MFRQVRHLVTAFCVHHEFRNLFMCMQGHPRAYFSEWVLNKINFLVCTTFPHLMVGYRNDENFPQIQQFDVIQEPLDDYGRRESRNLRRQLQSYLASHQVEPYDPPRSRPGLSLRERILKRSNIWPAAVSIAFIIGVIWVAFTILVGYSFISVSSLNPLRHSLAFALFAMCGVVFLLGVGNAGLMYLPVVGRRIIFIALCLMLTFAIVLIVLADKYRVFGCERMDQFPVYVEMRGLPFGQGIIGDVYFQKRKSWRMKHLGSDRNGTYYTYFSQEVRPGYPLQNPVRSEWPKTAVTQIWTSLKSNGDADGTVKGSCSGTPCLVGKIYMKPNLIFQWTYTNPSTGETRSTRLASNEGQWYFGKKYEPLVTLKNNGIEAFRAQGTNVVCSGGDGQLETSLVPTGLMMIAEEYFLRLNRKTSWFGLL
jgi:hypothetical protein